MFKKDQIVVYRYNICRVIDELPEYREGKDFYRLRGMYDETLVMTAPAALIDKHSRPVISHDEAKRLISGVSTYADIDMDSETVQSVCSEHVSKGGHKDLLRIIKTRYQQKCAAIKLGSSWKESDKSTFRAAEDIFFREMSVVLDQPLDEIRQNIYDRVETVTPQLA